MSGHYATLLRGTVEALLEEHDVYVTDWNDARDVPLSAGRFDLDDYIAYVKDYIGALGPDVHVIAVCQPAPAVLAAVALLAADNDPAQPRSMTLMGGPGRRAHRAHRADEARRRELAGMVRARAHDARAAMVRGRRARSVPGFLQIGAFMSMHPERHMDAHVKIFEDLVRGDGESAQKRRSFYDEYLSVMDITAEFYLQTVDEVFQRATLASGTMTWRGVPVVTRRDSQHRAAHGRRRARRHLRAGPNARGARAVQRDPRRTGAQNLFQPGVGHYGIFSGRTWREEIAPHIAAFITAQS